jgi:prepilin-type N-terminal cleavage/methylation domain-containing protein
VGYLKMISKRRQTVRGFTLLEMAIVLTLIALVSAMGLSLGRSVIESSKVTATNERMNAIETALMAYRMANNRLPCPGDGTVATNHTNYGKEMIDGSYNCSAPYSNPDVMRGNKVDIGSVPVRALGLPDEFMYDAWGRKFGYTVSSSMVKSNAFFDYGIRSNCAGIPIFSSNQTASISLSAVYVLISYGPNGHGARNASGGVVNAGSVNVDEQTNCFCNSSGAYSPAFPRAVGWHIIADNFVNPANRLDSFDDVVRYKERMQMGNYYDEVNPGGNLSCQEQSKSFMAYHADLQLGGQSVVIGDLNGDGFSDIIIGAQYASQTYLYNGTVHVTFGPLSKEVLGGAFEMDHSGWNEINFHGTAHYSYLGSSLAVGDINGDGIDDLVIGSGLTNSQKGSTFVVWR